MELVRDPREDLDELAWGRARREYVEGITSVEGVISWLTLDEIAARHGIESHQVRQRAIAEQWRNQRIEIREQLYQNVAMDMDSRALSTAQLGLMLVERRMLEIAAQQRAREAELDKDPEMLPDDLGGPVVRAEEIGALGKTAEQMYALAMKSFGKVDTIRHEISGPDGGALQIDTTARLSIRAELLRDDPERLHGTLVAIFRSDVLDIEEVIDDAEVIEVDERLR